MASSSTLQNDRFWKRFFLGMLHAKETGILSSSCLSLWLMCAFFNNYYCYSNCVNGLYILRTYGPKGSNFRWYCSYHVYKWLHRTSQRYVIVASNPCAKSDPSSCVSGYHWEKIYVGHYCLSFFSKPGVIIPHGSLVAAMTGIVSRVHPKVR